MRPDGSGSADRLLGARILVVDDMQANIDVLEALLGSAGYGDIVSATDPRAGLELYGSADPDLVLLDFRMPGMSGADFLRETHRRFPRQRPPVLVVTAQTDQATRRAALEAGARDFVTKPFDVWELLTRVRNLLELHFLVRDQAARADALERIVDARTRELREAHREIVQRLCTAGEFRDQDTGHHVARIGSGAGALARLMGCGEEVANLMETAAPLHDIGKIAIPDRILLKQGPLTDDEWVVMRGHTTAGHRILAGSGISMLDLAAEIALGHHERWDGTGYPHGLSGDAIPLAARIVAVVDVFDALSSARPYKRAWPQEEVVVYLRDQRGRHFDPAVVDTFLAGLDDISADTLFRTGP
jgi:putative two-component system response regulator